MQKPKPPNATGVPVHLTAIDPNGNFQDIGTATSNSLGNYAFAWTPPIPGLYTVTATFAGSNSFYSSEAGTSFIVSTASSVSPVVTPTPTPSTTSIVTPTPSGIVTPSPTTPQGPGGIPASTLYAIAAAVVVIAVVAVAERSGSSFADPCGRVLARWVDQVGAVDIPAGCGQEPGGCAEHRRRADPAADDHTT